jgi:5-methyltetrahydropteroyltriglutamate--homocysteine methyltransferase
VKTSIERILTTHAGSLPRPAGFLDHHDPAALPGAVEEMVRHQVEVGIDVISDGEASKPSYATYVIERLSGFGGEPVPLHMRGLDAFPEFAAKRWGDPGKATMMTNPTCDGPVAYLDRSLVEADIANLKACAGGTDAFMTAASPGVIEFFMGNKHYPTTEEYLFALADAMKEEYDAICQAGLVLQLDCPDLACAWAFEPEQTREEFRKQVALRLEALDYATRDVPAGQLRMHLCWGNYEGPHHLDVPLIDIIDLVLAARPQAVSFEAANPRHAHEWKIFEDIRLPEGKVIIPGVLDTTTNYIEHDELVAQRLLRYASVVGKTSIMAGSDCGFASAADDPPIDPRIAWAKLAALARGSRLASEELWGNAASQTAGGHKEETT